MRDPDRLDAFYNTLRELHKTNFPDWRFGQFLVNFLRWYGNDPFFLEEDDFLKKVKEFIKYINENLA